MAKRRKLEAPSVADLDTFEEEFRRETLSPDTRRGAPIAQVAGETAAAMEFAVPDHLNPKARDAKDAQQLKDLEEKGLLLLEIPLSAIDSDSMIRDRSILDTEALDELKASVLKNGMRLPIEVYPLSGEASDGQGHRFGLLSGYRRLRVLRDLHAQMGGDLFSSARAILRKPATDRDRFSAMVEENEIRQQLSHYERGRIAAISAQHGVFENTEAAVATMFPAASKAKRSKIRSFAMIFEELGDSLSFPENLKEKDGLRIASALRDGRDEALREALAESNARTADDELVILNDMLDGFEASPGGKARGGRPRAKVKAPGWDGNTLRLSSGITLRKGSDAKGYSIHLNGPGLTSEVLEDVVNRISYLLEKPD